VLANFPILDLQVLEAESMGGSDHRPLMGEQLQERVDREYEALTGVLKRAGEAKVGRLRYDSRTPKEFWTEEGSPKNIPRQTPSPSDSQISIRRRRPG